MVKGVREVERALGSVTYELSEKVEKNRKFARSLFVVSDIKEGEELTRFNVRSIRPGYGLHPKYLDDILGRKAKTNLTKGEPLSWDLIS